MSSTVPSDAYVRRHNETLERETVKCRTLIFQDSDSDHRPFRIHTYESGSDKIFAILYNRNQQSTGSVSIIDSTKEAFYFELESFFENLFEFNIGIRKAGGIDFRPWSFSADYDQGKAGLQLGNYGSGSTYASIYGGTSASALGNIQITQKSGAPEAHRIFTILRQDGTGVFEIRGGTRPHVFVAADGSSNTGALGLSGLFRIQGTLNEPGIRFDGSGTTQPIVAAGWGGTQYKYRCFENGKMSWSPGNAAADVELSRIGVDVLGTPDSLEMTELSTDIPAGLANTVRLYSRDNGAGKTQLVARFATGAVQVLATEP